MVRHTRFWQTIHEIESGAAAVARDRSELVLDTCADYQDAVDSLLGLESAPLTLKTQATCRELRLLVDRLAVEVAGELRDAMIRECGS